MIIILIIQYFQELVVFIDLPLASLLPKLLQKSSTFFKTQHSASRICWLFFQISAVWAGKGGFYAIKWNVIIDRTIFYSQIKTVLIIKPQPHPRVGFYASFRLEDFFLGNLQIQINNHAMKKCKQIWTERENWYKTDNIDNDQTSQGRDKDIQYKFEVLWDVRELNNLTFDLSLFRSVQTKHQKPRRIRNFAAI